MQERDDINQAIRHEQLAIKGLRAMLGKKNKFMTRKNINIVLDTIKQHYVTIRGLRELLNKKGD